MFVRYKISSTALPISILLIFITFLLASPTRAANISGDTNCSDETCSVSINHEATISNFCPTSSLTIVWKKHSRIYMMQCNLRASMQLNPIWIVDMNKDKISKAPDGRFVKKSFISQSDKNTRIPDKFSSYPLCSLPNKNLVENSSFTILQKEPSDGNSSYCYNVYYIDKHKDNYVFRDNQSKLINQDDKTTPSSKEHIFNIIKSIENKNGKCAHN